MTTTATATNPAANAPLYVPPIKLAPPFGTAWSRVVTPAPVGFNGSAQLDSCLGSVRLHLGAKPHPPTSPTVFGWFGAGWRRRVSVQLATNFVAAVTCSDVTWRGGGVFVPRLFVILRPVAGGPERVASAVLSKGQTSYVSVTVPQSPNLPAFVAYDLEVRCSLRSAYARTQSPQGSVVATIESVTQSFAFPTATEESQGLLGLVDSELEAEEPDLELADLEAMLASSRAAKVFPIESDLAAFAGGLETLEA